MLTVYTFGPAFGLPDASPFVVKLETWLRMAKIAYRSERGDARKAPKKKLPYVEVEGRQLPDSSQIIDFLSEKHGDPLNDARFGAKDRALGRALKSMFEAEMYFVTAYLRWWNDEDFEKMRPVLMDFMAEAGVPRFARGAAVSFARRGARAQIEAQGTGRHAREEVFAQGRSLVDAAAELLGEKKFFLDDAPSTLDATAYGMLSGIAFAPFDNPVKARVLERENLVAYCERVRETYWAG